MGTRQGSALLAQTRRRFERWRQIRKPGTRIPEALWAAAVRVARVQGPGATANALGIDFYALKRRMGHAPAESSKGPQFVELRAAATPPAVTLGVPQCVLELEDARGTKLRVQLTGATAADIAHVSRRLWSARTCSRSRPKCASSWPLWFGKAIETSEAAGVWQIKCVASAGHSLQCRVPAL